MEIIRGSDRHGCPSAHPLHHSSDVGSLLQVEALRDGVKGELVDPWGNALPPCIVMERGESLQEWANRAKPDLFASLAVRPYATATLPNYCDMKLSMPEFRSGEE